MKTAKLYSIACCTLCVLMLSVGVLGQVDDARAVDKWVTVEAEAAGVGGKARDQAVAQALRKAVEQACGMFINAQSKTVDYRAVYDKIFANTVGYVREHKVLKVSDAGIKTTATVRVRVSTKRFEADWATIAHTVEQENNPRVIIAIVEAVHQHTGAPNYTIEDGGTVQSKVEDFFLSKGIRLMDRKVASDVTKRDVLLAAIKNDDKEMAALGARFKADVVIAGRATAKFGKQIDVAGQRLYQYTAKLNVRIIRTDSAGLLVSKTFGPFTSNSLQRGGGEDKALAKLADAAAPKLLAAMIEAWRKQINVRRNIEIIVSGMDYKKWKIFREEAKKLRGIDALRLRDITESTATIDVEYKYSTTTLADELTALKSTKLEVTEITANRIKLKILE